jgi:hypothetical protein
VTDEALLEQIRKTVANESAKLPPRPRTAARCRTCWAENEGHLEKCRACGRALERARAGTWVRCPEAGSSRAIVTFVIEVGDERRARLGPGGRLVVGRGDDADVWLEASTVSRAHCEIVWDRGTALPRFRDLGSANGTRHQGALRAEGILAPGETLEVGPYRLSVVRDQPASLALAPTDEELDAFFDPGPEFQGSLGPGIASLMLRALAQAERTGTFEVALERGTGCVVLAAGRVVSARAGRLTGLASLHLILAAERGAYRFRRTFEVDDLEPVDLTVEEVLAAVPG